jgi:hypothetical protein
MSDLEERFNEEMIGIYKRAKKECDYIPTRFLQMVIDQGGRKAAKELLLTPGFSYGFEKLWELGRLDLSMEALVLREPWRQLFSEQELRIARTRLDALGYSPEGLTSA